MFTKFSKLSFIVLSLSFYICTGLFAASADKASAPYFKLDRAPHYAFPAMPSTNPEIGQNQPTRELGYAPTQSPGYQAGITTHDQQHIGTMGRQIGFDPVNDMVHMLWTGQTNTALPGDRHVRYQAYDPTIYPTEYILTSDGETVTVYYSGYVTIDVLNDGRAAFAANTDQSGTYEETCIYTDFAPGYAIYSMDCLVPDPGAAWYYSGIETVWPQYEIQYGTDEVHYALTHDQTGSDDMILYRKVGGASWDQGNKVEDCANISYTIVADDNSDKVAIVYTDDRSGLAPGAGGQSDLDVYYMESTDQGVSWSAPQNVSNYTASSLWRAYTDLATMYTDDGDLHILWAARELEDSTTYYNYRSRLFHWSVNNPQPVVVANAQYTMAGGSPGKWNLYIAKPSIAECNGNLYALWTQFGHPTEPMANFDFSAGGYANGELFHAVSGDGGRTWDYPLNLTNTRNPGCSPPDCESEHWASMSKSGMYYSGVDDTLDIVYISDLDAGSIVDGEGTWQVNTVMHLRIGCRDENLIPILQTSPPEFGYPAYAYPWEETIDTLYIANTGTSTLNWNAWIDYIDSSSWLNLSMTSGILPADAGYEDIIEVTFNNSGILTEDLTSWEANIIIDSDAPSSPDTVPVILTILHVDSWPQFEELSTACKSVRIYNTGRIGGDTEYQSLDIPDDCDSVDEYPNTAIYLYDASPMISWLNGDDTLAYTTIFTQFVGEDGTYIPMTGLEITSESGYDSAYYAITTTDEVFTVDVNLWAPTDPSYCFIIGKYDFALADGASPVYDVNLGMILDWDIPSDTGVKNYSDYSVIPVFPNDTIATVWQYGLEAHDDNQSVPCNISEADRVGGVALLGSDFRTGWTTENAPYYQGSGLDPVFLYEMMAQPGYDNMHDNMEPIDLHTGVTFDKVDMDLTRSTHSYVFALATTLMGEDDFQYQIEDAYYWAFDHGLLTDTCAGQYPGDADADGIYNFADAIYLVNGLCKGFDLPDPLANGDPNGDCIIDLNDANYIIDNVFRGGPPPVECTCIEPEVIIEDCTWEFDSCYTDPVFVVCPAGDMPFRVYLRNFMGQPVPGISPFYVQLTGCNGVELCPSDTTSFDHVYSGPSDENGIQSFYISGGGCVGGCNANVYHVMDLLATVPVVSLDRDTNLIVSALDYDSTVCNDYNGDGEINFHDVDLFNEHLGHSCDALDPCDLFGADFFMEPESNLMPDDTVELRLELSNNNTESDCYVGNIEFFATPYGDDTSTSVETPIDELFFDSVLAPGQMAIATVNYAIPEDGHGCVNVRFTTDCCPDPIVKSKCFQSYEHCRVDSNVCYNMVIRLSRTPVYSARWYETILPGWSLYKMYEPTYPISAPDSVVFDICTPNLTNLGDSSVTIYQVFYDEVGVKSSRFQNRVVLTSRTGDVNNDCAINVGDIVYIINYVFKNGPAPDPLESGDVNRDDAVNVGDAVYLINFVFKNGPPPGLL